MFSHPVIKFMGLLAFIGLGLIVMIRLGIRWSDLQPSNLRTLILSFGWWAPIVYIIGFAQPLLPLPSSVVLMAGGLAFGVPLGAGLALVAGTIRGCGQFLIARRLGREAIEAILHGHLASLDRSVARAAFATVFWVRAIPNIPFDLQNYSFGCSRVPFFTFLPATSLGLIPMVLMWTWAGYTLTDPTQLWRIVVLLVLFFALWIISRRHRTVLMDSNG